VIIFKISIRLQALWKRDIISSTQDLIRLLFAY
jgi:hypothetical protein